MDEEYKAIFNRLLHIMSELTELEQELQPFVEKDVDLALLNIHLGECDIPNLENILEKIGSKIDVSDSK